MSEGWDRRRVVEVDKRHVWHPYTPMKAWVEETDPLVIERASGSMLHDVDGRSYIDGISSWWVAALGHGHPRIVAAATDQLRTLGHVSMAGVTHEVGARLAEALVRRAPAGLTRAFFTDDGSTALEAAIKIALGYHRHRGARQRTRFLSVSNAFHGETLGVTALSGVATFRSSFDDVLMEVLFLPPPSEGAPSPELEARSLERLDELLEAEGERIAACVVEPRVQGAAGMNLHSPDYLRQVFARCRAAGVLVIADEVFVGFGRTGPFWASSSSGLSPDLLCSAKALSGGLLPFAATLTTEEVFMAFWGPPENALFYGHSFCGNPLGARVALEVLSIYEDERVLESVAERAPILEEGIARIAARVGAEGARSLGMIGAFNLGTSDYLEPIGKRIGKEARARGAYVRPLGNVVYLAPPLNVPLPVLRDLLAILEESVVAATSR